MVDLIEGVILIIVGDIDEVLYLHHLTASYQIILQEFSPPFLSRVREEVEAASRSTRPGGTEHPSS